jgi:pyrimidine operon attenuation protein / uracil phosphoribosyltransferase
MSLTHHLLLNSDQITQKIKRIAWEIYERNYYETGIVIAGIDKEGYEFARRLVIELKAISPLHLKLVKIKLQKHAPFLPAIELDIVPENLENGVVIVADDVLNTGRTLWYAISPFLGYKLKKLQTAVIVDRNHRLFPIRADYVGFTLSTTLHEHVSVNMDAQGPKEVVLS